MLGRWKMVSTVMSIKDNQKVLLFFVLAVAFCVRIGFAWAGYYNVPSWPDEHYYMQTASQLYNGEGYVVDSQPTAYHPVGYPLILAGFFLLGVDSVFWLQLMQVIIAVLTLYLLYRLASELFDHSVAFIAVLLAAFYPYMIFTPSRILPTTLFTFFLLLATFLLYKGKRDMKKIELFLSGLCFGISVLIKSTALVLFLVAAVWYMLSMVKEKGLPLKESVLLTVGVLCLLTPWLYRNQQVFGSPVLGTNFGYNLWLGNQKNANIRSSIHNTKLSWHLQQRLSAELDELQRDRIFLNQALNNILQQPVEFLKRYLKKMIYFWRLDPSPTTSRSMNRNDWLTWLSIISFTPLLCFSILGFYSGIRNEQREVYLLILYVLAFTLLHALFFPKVRFRLPLEVYLFIPAALSVKNLFYAVNSQ